MRFRCIANRSKSQNVGFFLELETKRNFMTMSFEILQDDKLTFILVSRTLIHNTATGEFEK